MEGGERIAVKSGLLEVVHTPGHAPGHLCLFSPEKRFLISGDHLLKAITPNIAWRPEEDMLARYLESLEAMKPLDVDWVIPSHGKPFQGHRGSGGRPCECTMRNAANRLFRLWPKNR